MSASVVRRRVRVSGRVQGVWFRQSAREQAVALSVAGWVRNLSDGRVEAEFEGPVAAVERMVSWCREGPRGAYVAAIDVEDRPPVGDTEFHVR